MSRARRRAPEVAPTRAPSRGRTLPLRIAGSVLLLFGVVPLANFLTDGPGLPWWSDAARQWALWSVATAVVAGLLGATIPTRLERAAARCTALLEAPPKLAFALLVGATTTALSLWFGWSLFHLERTVGDEFAQAWQGHLIAGGRLTGRLDAPQQFFSTVQSLHIRERWFSQFPVGGPALLAVGEWIRAPWLVNPVLAGVTAVLFYRLAARVTRESTGRWMALLLTSSPFVLFMSGSQMNHAGALAGVVLALWALSHWFEAPTISIASRWAAVIGAALGCVAAVRPFDAAVVGLVIGVFQVLHLRASPDRARSLLAQALAGAVPVVILLASNALTTGHPLAFAYDVLNGPEHRPGFHMTPLGFEHTPVRALYMASAYLLKLDAGLFAWPVPAILLVAATLLLARSASRWDAILLAILFALLAGYAAYWSESYFVGPRFLYVAVPALAWYTALLPGALRARIAEPRARAAVLALVPFWLAVAWLAPERDGQLFGVRQLARLYRMPPRAAAPVVDAARRAGITNAVVFVPEGWHARLTARLRAMGMRPLAAETLVSQADACTLQHALDAAALMEERVTGQRIDRVMAAVVQDQPAQPLTGASPSEAIALVPGRTLTDDCRAEMERAASGGLSIAELLPYQQLDANGSPGGAVVFARDFGAGNEALRARYGTRTWYVLRTARENGALSVAFDPYAPAPGATSR